MYFQPYGDDQQLNLNWIINEIINLHKQFDPDYETPSFTQVYPYSNLNRLNLDWILSELKALKELAPEPVPQGLDIQAVAEALVALPFDSNTSYQIYDFISRDGEIWRATEAIAAGGEWDSSKWFKTKIGTDLAVLDRWINTINNSLTSEIETRQNADTTLQTHIDNEALARQQADTALQTHIDNEALARQQADTALQNTINGLTSANISDDSDAGGANVKTSLNALKGSLNSVESAIAIVADGNTHAAIASRQYVYVKNHSTLAEGLYKATAAIPLNGAISSTNVSAVTNGGLNQITPVQLGGTGQNNVLSAADTFRTALMYKVTIPKQSTVTLSFLSKATLFYAYIGATPLTCSIIVITGYDGHANLLNLYEAQTPGYITFQQNGTNVDITNSDTTRDRAIDFNLLNGLPQDIIIS